MNYVEGTPTEYNILGFVYLGIMIAFVVYLSVLHIRRSKRILEAREERNRARRDDH